MHSLQKQFHDFILTNELVKKGEKVLLAVSGGLDSMAMAHLFLNEGVTFAIAHCNYGLRGDESDGDEAFVMNWTEKNGVNCYVKGFEIKGSIQIEARNARYKWFNELMDEEGWDKVATAHHLNDSLETILINSNPATIMTDPSMADHVYLLPLTTKSLVKILEEHPQIDAVLPTMGVLSLYGN